MTICTKPKREGWYIIESPIGRAVVHVREDYVEFIGHAVALDHVHNTRFVGPLDLGKLVEGIEKAKS